MSITKEKALQLYEKMCTIREFEELVKKEYLAGNLPGFVHLYIGEEAVASGICGALEECDYIEENKRLRKELDDAKKEVAFLHHRWVLVPKWQYVLLKKLIY